MAAANVRRDGTGSPGAFRVISRPERSPHEDLTQMPHSAPKLHNAMWPGLVGKGDRSRPGTAHFSLERMLDLTAAANGRTARSSRASITSCSSRTPTREASDSMNLKKIADTIAKQGFSVGSLVAPVWPGTVGDSAMGDAAAREKFLSAPSRWPAASRRHLQQTRCAQGRRHPHRLRRVRHRQVARESQGQHRAKIVETFKRSRQDRAGPRRTARSRG